MGLGSVFSADVLIAVSMCYILYRKRTGFTRQVIVLSLLIFEVKIDLTPMCRTDSTMMTLISYCISSGVVTW
jgi:hypothetical protein